MEITITLTEKETELLNLFRKREYLNTADNFGGWRGTDEWDSFVDNNLIYHHNRSDYDAYISYKLTDYGKKMLKDK